MLGRVLVVAACLLTFLASRSLRAEDSGSSSTSANVQEESGSPADLKADQAFQTVESKPLESKIAEASQSIESTARVSKPEPLKTRVLFITEAGSSRCEQELERLGKTGGDFEAMRKRGWKIGPGPENHIQTVDRSEIPDLVRELSVREFPTVACISDGKILRAFKDGCTTPLDSWTLGWLYKGQNERPTAVVGEPARVASTGSYRLRGNHWSVDGDWQPALATLIKHLRSPVHAYGIASNWRIENWSYEELRSLHDDLHEREMSSNSYYSTSSGSKSLWPQKHSASSKISGR